MTSQSVVFLENQDVKSCLRCKELMAVILTRNEKFCKQCYLRFVRGKQRKQMQDESYKVKYSEALKRVGMQKVLLPWSGGMSSLVLVDVIGTLLQEQREAHNGRQGFELMILHIEEEESDSLKKNVRFALSELVHKYNPVQIKFKILSLNSLAIDPSLIKKIEINNSFEGLSQPIKLKEGITVKELLSSCADRSSSEDLLNIIRDDIIIRTAHLEDCKTILYGHSMTRIANEVISLTVKGRGASIHKSVSDHATNYKEKSFNIIYPLREVLLVEVAAYLEIASLKSFVIESTSPRSKITKNMTVRDLVTQYFTHLDETGYASTASTVVKTGEKLGEPKFELILSNCQVCGVNIHQDPKKWLSDITVTEPAALVDDEQRKYADMVSSKANEVISNDLETPINLCYGCTITIAMLSKNREVLWPITESGNDQSILDMYILDDLL